MTSRRRTARRLAAMTASIVALLAVAGATTAASAASTASGASGASTTPSGSTTSPTAPTMVVIDASGSMLVDDAPGPRIDAAKSAVRSLVSGLPAGAEVGLMVYGAGTGSTEAEKAAGCQDVRTLVPVGPVDAAGFLATVDGIVAAGYTPIGLALREAAAALPQEGPRAIVLVSDGEDTCAPPPPCEVAAELAGAGLDLTVHTVGFKVNEAARADLQCIAEATGGTYSDAEDASQLDQVVRTKVELALRGYDVVGTPVTGALYPDQADLPVLTPGQWVDQLPPITDGTEQQSRFYSIEPEPGWTAHVSAVGVVATDASQEGFDVVLRLRLTTPSGADCRSDQAYLNYTANPTEPLVTSVRSSCSGRQIVEVERVNDLYATEPMDLELVVRFEPPSDISHIAEPEERGRPAPPERSATVLPIEGGTSFNVATEIVPGQTYGTTITMGEHLYVKIPVTWGQQIGYSFEPTTYEGASDWYANVTVEVFDPMRRNLSDARAYESWHGPDGPITDRPVQGGTTQPVRATSRDYGLDGYYYLSFSMWSQGMEGFVQHLEFTVDTTGEIEEGPVYLVGGATPDPGASPSPTPSDETSTAVAGAADGSTDDGADRGSGVLWPVLGVGLVGALGGAAAVLVVRRRSGPTPPR